MTVSEAHQIFRMVLAGWVSQRQKIDDHDLGVMAKFYAAGLLDLDFGPARQAIERLSRTSSFIPTVASIREAVGIIIHGEQPTGVEAWGSVVRAMQGQGVHRTPGVEFTFRDPITARVVRDLGWANLCKSDNAVADRAKFVDTYDKISRSERTHAQASPGGTNPQLESGIRLPQLDDGREE